MTAPIEPKYVSVLQTLGRDLNKLLNPDGVKRVGFAVLMFDLNTSEGRMNYISNAQREDMVTAMKEFLSNLEFGEHEGAA